MSENEQLALVPVSQVKESIETPTPQSDPAEKETVDPAATPEGDDQPPQPIGKKPNKYWARERVEEYKQLRAETARERDYWRDLALKNGTGQTPAATTGQTGDWKAQNRPPREEDFPGNYEAFLEARVEYKLEQKLTERDRTAQQKAQERTQAEQQEKFRERLDKGFEKYPDFEDVALSPDVPVNEHMAYAIGDSDQAADIMYYLGKNPKEAERIAKLAPLAAAREIGKIEDKIAAAPATTEAVTAAPKPIRTVSGNARSQTSPEKESIEEFMRRENEKDRKRYLGR